MKVVAVALSLAVALLQAGSALAQDQTQQKIEAALELDYRTEKDRARDRNRDPVDALEFMGFKDDMRVFEFGPGGGWYTMILAPVLKDNGELVVGYPRAWLADIDDLLATEPMSEVKQVDMDMGWDEEELVYTFNEIDFGPGEYDMFLNIRNYHNLSMDDRAAFNKAVYDSLKPGGTFVIIDHTRRHMQDDDPENWRREDPVLVLVEVQDAGFELEKYSDMFYRADDTLEYEVGRRTVTGNTDRFFFVFRKP
ncbi:MAG: methyltransferase [Pseudomonadota bacterium]